jgi:hypothetical protein
MPFYDQNGQQVAYDPSGYGGNDTADLLPAGFDSLPTLGGAVQQRQNKGLLGPALKKGMYNIGGALGAGLGAVGGAIGNDAIRDYGIGISDRMNAAGDAAGRPELDVMPWSPEWGKQGQTMADLPAWAAYQVGQQIPQGALAIAGGGLIGGAMKAAEIAAPGAELAAELPAWLGGGGLKAGMAATEAAEARKVGADLAQNVAGATIGGIPQAAGSMYQGEVDRSRQPGQDPNLSQGAAMQALGLSPIYSFLDATGPSEGWSVLKRGLAGNLGRRMATRALSEGVQETVQEGLQTGMEMAFRPDLSPADKAQNIIDSALVGGLVGGVMGGASGIRRLKTADPTQVSDSDLAAAADEDLQTPGTPLPPDQQAPMPLSAKQLNNQWDQIKKQGEPPAEFIETLADALGAAPKLGPFQASAKNLAASYGLLQGGKNSRKVVTPEQALDALYAEQKQLQDEHDQRQALASGAFGPAVTIPSNDRLNELPQRIQVMEGIVAKRKGAAAPQEAAPAAAPQEAAPQEVAPAPAPMTSMAPAPQAAPAPVADMPPVDETPFTPEFKAAEGPRVEPPLTAHPADISDAALQALLPMSGKQLGGLMKGKNEIRVGDLSLTKSAGKVQAAITTPDGEKSLGEFSSVGQFMEAVRKLVPEERINYLSSSDTPLIQPENPRAVSKPSAETPVLGEDAQTGGEMGATHAEGDGAAAASATRPLRQESARTSKKKQQADLAASLAAKTAPQAEGRWHGTGEPIKNLSDAVALSGQHNKNIYGEGFYTTNSPEAAHGYTKKGGSNPTLYSVQEKPTKLYDMEAPLDPRTHEMVAQVLGDAMPEGDHANLRELLDDFRDQSASNRISRDEVQEAFDAIRQNLEAQGYRGYEHTGGLRTNTAPHNVRIYWHPEQDVSISDANKPQAAPKKELQQDKARASRKPKVVREARAVEKTAEGFNLDALKMSWPKETLDVAEAMVKGEMSPDQALATVAERAKGWKSGGSEAVARFKNLAERYKIAAAEQVASQPKPLTAKERKATSALHDRINKGHNGPNGITAENAFHNLVFSDQSPKTQAHVATVMREQHGVELTDAEVQQAADSLPGNVKPSVIPTPPPPKPMRKATERTRAEIAADWAPYTAGLAARDRARRERDRAGNTGNAVANERRAKVEKIIDVLENGGRISKAPADSSGAKFYDHNGYKLPIMRTLSIKDLHDHLMRMTSGHKTLRALSPLLARVGHLPVLIAPREDILAATGGGAAFIGAKDTVIMPNVGEIEPELYVRTYAHELVHAAMQHRLERDNVARSQLTLIAKEVQAAFGLDPDLYAFKDAHEFLSEIMSRPDLQELLDSKPMSDKLAKAVGLEKGISFLKGIFQKIGEWLGYKGSPTLLDGVLRVAERLETKEKAANIDFLQMLHSELGGRYAGNDDHMLADRANAEANKQAMATTTRLMVAGVDNTAARFNREIDQSMQKLSDKADLGVKARAMELYWSSFGHILQRFGKLFKPISEALGNPIEAYGNHMLQRAGLTARMSQLYRNANDQLKGLIQKDKNAGKYMTDLMQGATEFGLRPDKALTDQSEKVKEYMAKNDANRNKMTSVYNVIKDSYERLRRIEGVSKGQPGVYEKYRAINDMLLHSYNAVQLYNALRLDSYFVDTAPHLSGRPSLAEAIRDPVEQFLKQADLHEDPIKAAKYWRETVEKRVQQVEAYAAAVRGVVRPDADKKTFENSYGPIDGFVQQAKRAIESTGQSTYFHLGRHGQYIVRFGMRPDPSNDKVVDPDAVRQISRLLQKDFPNVRISPESDNPHVMARFESKGERDRFRAAVKALEGRGLVVRNSTQVAQRDTVAAGGANMQPLWLQKYISAINGTEGLTPKQKQQMAAVANALWLDQLNDTAIQRVLAERDFVPGFNADMLRNFAFRAEVGINALANLSITSKVRDAFSAMDNQLKSDEHGDPAIYDKKFQVVQELRQRDADRPLTTGHTWLDDWRAYNQAFFLGMSPAYVAVNMTQLGVMLLPELAKRHGFVQAAKIMAKVTPQAFDIIRETFKDGKKLGWSRAFDAIITENVLKAALPKAEDAETRAFLTRMVNSGNIDLGSPMRELGRASEGVQDKKRDQVLRMASAAGYYSETLTRVIAALAAHELDKKAQSEANAKAGRPDVTDQARLDRYASQVLNEAMLNYSNWFTARATGKTGLMGQFTPIPASFQQYTLQVLQKMQRELLDAFSAKQPDESDEEHADRVKGARRFLLGHATVIGVLAGSLGMPFATVAMRAADALRDALGDDDEPHDTKTDYRNFLADTFGEEFGEVLARGLPRAFGADISGRVGEQDLLPFSRFIADRRKMQDALKDLVVRSVGSPVGMGLGIANGGSEVLKGNYLDGLQMMVPNSIKGLMKAGRMVEGGYEDAKGVPLPIQADPSDIIWQALGFNPADKADYTEANMARATRKTALQQSASQMRDDLVAGVEGGGIDQATLDRARSFGERYPLYSVLPTLGSAVNRRKQQAAMAKAQGVPLGTNPADLDEQNYLRFANLRR